MYDHSTYPCLSNMPHALDTTVVKLLTGICSVADTVNPEIFAMVLFSRNLANAKFRENKIFAK